MAISHFKITRLPSEDVIAKIGADLLQKDQLYPIDRQNEIQFDRVPTLQGYYVIDSLSYQVYEEATNRYGNIADVTVQWRENDLGTPLISESVTSTMINQELIKLLDLMPINKAVEFIEVTAASGINGTKHNSVAIVAGDRLSPSELSKATFKVIDGGGAPYFELEYKLGRGQTLSEETYKITINVDTMAGVAVTSQEKDIYVLTDDNGFQQQYASDAIGMIVSGAPSLSDVLVEVTIDHPWIDNDPNAQTEVDVSGYGRFITAFPEVFQITGQTNKSGELLIDITTEFPYTEGSVYTGSATVQIMSINEGFGNVSPENHIATAQTNIP